MKINRLISSAILGIVLVGLLGSTPASAGTGASIAAAHSHSGFLAALERLLSHLGFNVRGAGSGSGFLGGNTGV